MCGIVGQLRFDDAPVDRHLVTTMADHLRHRGPDGAGFHFERRIGLGHRRLALVDPDGMGQPVSNEDGSLWLVANQEIYNHVELRRELEGRGHQFRTAGDAEVVLHLYEDVGEAAFAQIVGMFALALWDERREILFLVRDPFGIKPLHYTRGSMGSFAFASEMGALLCDPAIDRSIDFQALDGYLRTLAVPEPRSILRSVGKVPAGHFMRVTRQGTDVCRFYELEVGVCEQKTEDDLEDQLRCRLEETVRMSLRSDSELGFFLSGGIDSSALVATASRINGGPVRTYSLGFDEKPFDESSFSRLVSRKFESLHCEVRLSKDRAVDATEHIVDRLHEPFADSSALPTFVLAERAAHDVKAVLSGEGLDELFAGNIWHLPAADSASSDGDADLLEDPRRAIFARDTLAELYESELRGEIRHGRDGVDALASREPSIFARDPVNKKLAFDLRSYLPSDLLTKMDRLPMASSLEVRVPYLNAPFASFVGRMDISLKIRGDVQKYLFKKMLRGVVPDAVLDRPKKGFAIPLDVWLWQDGRFRDMVLDVLNDSTTRQRGLFRAASIDKMIEEHGRLERFHGHRLWTLFMFEMWQRRVQDVPAPKSRVA